METEILGFKRRWELTAPESYLLLYGPQNWARTQALKLALVELIARGKLSLEHKEERSFLGQRRTTSLLGLVEEGYRKDPQDKWDTQSLARPLAAMLGLAQDFEVGAPLDRPRIQSSTIPLTKFLKAVRKRYGWPGGYAEAEVMPILEHRGLYERQPPIFPAFFSSTSDWERTNAGVQKREELREGMSAGEDRFGEWVDHEPQLALSFLGYAGSAALIMPELRRDLQRLMNLMDRHREIDAARPTAGPEVEVPGGVSIEDADNYSSYPETLSLEGITLDFDVLGGMEVSEAMGPLVAGAGGGAGGDGGGGGGGA